MEARARKGLKCMYGSTISMTLSGHSNNTKACVFDTVLIRSVQVLF